MEEIYEIVCSYSKVKEHLAHTPGDKQKIYQFINEIRGEYSGSMLTVMEKFLDSTFVKLYDGFNVQTPEGFDLDETLKSHHVILCPNHQSHADYLALQYIFYKKFAVPVYIAAGINLNIFPIGKIFKKCGAFFIRRKFDDDVYKIAFQGYIYYLLKTDKVVEFFFEGGRTRTGKLLSPRYGLFSMILDAHSRFDDKKPLMFIPVSIAHEYIPEEGAHAKELGGAKKVKESPTQLLKLFSLFSKKLGTVHVRFNEGVVINEVDGDLKLKTQELAFECFRRVGKGMPVTPSSLLSLILLDEPSGALTWKQIETSSQDVIDYCKHMGINLTQSLMGDQSIRSIRSAMDMFINNKKVELLRREKLNQVFYVVADEARVNLLYHKNMILHHFFVPAIINSTWFNIFNGNIKTAAELRKFLLLKRKELKYEFYLPSIANMLDEGIKLIEYALGRKIGDIGDVLSLNVDELYQIAAKVRRFSSALSYIYEAYYISMVTAKYLSESAFSEEKFIQVAAELFELEREHGRVVKYPESFTIPNMKSTLEYLMNSKLIEQNEKGLYQVVDSHKIGLKIEKFARDVNDQVALNLKFKGDDETITK